MNALAAVVKEVVGLFVYDEGLALSILGVVAVAFVTAFGLHAPSLVTGAVVVLGCVAALAVSALRGRR